MLAAYAIGVTVTEFGGFGSAPKGVIAELGGVYGEAAFPELTAWTLNV